MKHSPAQRICLIVGRSKGTEAETVSLLANILQLIGIGRVKLLLPASSVPLFAPHFRERPGAGGGGYPFPKITIRAVVAFVTRESRSRS